MVQSAFRIHLYKPVSTASFRASCSLTTARRARVVYDADIVPIQAPGCECIGNCGDPANRKTCACLQRQIAASKSRVGGGKRSDRQDFAYDRDSCLFEDALGWQDPIMCVSEQSLNLVPC